MGIGIIMYKFAYTLATPLDNFIAFEIYCWTFDSAEKHARAHAELFGYTYQYLTQLSWEPENL